MKTTFRFLFFILVQAILTSLFSQQAQAQVKINKAVNFSVTDTHGQQHTLFDYLDDDKYVLIDFFFTTCQACNIANPNIIQAYKQYGCNQKDVVFIALNRGNSDAQVCAYLDKYKGFIPTASGINGHADDIVTAYGVTAFPTIVLIAPDHSFVSKDIYPVTKANLDKAIHLNAGRAYNNNCYSSEHHVLSRDIELILYPNPVINTASIQIHLDQSLDVQVKIINILGQTIDTPIDSLLTEPITKEIDFSQFRPGVYFIQLVAQGQIISTQRFSKIAP